MKITFCGHSDYVANENDEKRLLSIFEQVGANQQIIFLLGGYGRFDGFARHCAKIYQSTHPNAKLIFVTPYIDKWLDSRKEHLCSLYDEIVYPEIETTPKKFAVSKRNEWMVDTADFVIAYVRRHFGGAYKTLLYADKTKTEFVNIYDGNFPLY